MRRRFYRILNLFIHIIWQLQVAQWRGWLKDSTHKDDLLKLMMRLSKLYKNTAVELGGLLIKFGQFFGSRIDILPEEVIQEMSQLQDRIPPVDYNTIKKTVENEFKKPISEVYTYYLATSGCSMGGMA